MVGTRQSLNFFFKKNSLPSAMVMALGKAGKRVGASFSSFAECSDHCTRQTDQNQFFYSFFTFHHDKHKLSHISHIHPNIHHIFITSIAYITYINPNIYHIYHSYPNIPLVHDKYIRNPSPSEQQMQIQLMLLITKVETECLVKEKLDQSEAHELDYLNPPTEAAQRKRDCMR